MCKFSIYCSVILAVLFSSCSLIPSRQTSAVLDDVASYINERPDSALKVLTGIDSTTLNTRGLRARHALLLTMSRDKSYQDITTPGLLAPAEKYFERHGTPDERMKALYYRGRIAQENHSRNDAAVFFSRAEEYADEITDRHALGVLYMTEASVFNEAHNITKEKEYITKGLEVFEEIGDPMHDIALGQLAICSFNLREWSRADSLFAVGISAAAGNPHTLAQFLSNYARMKLLQPFPEPEEALALLDQMQKVQGRRLSLRDAGAYAYALILSGRESDAKKIMGQIQNQEASLKVDPWLCRCAVALEDYEQAYRLLNQANLSEESEIQSVLSDSVSEAISDYQEMAANQKRMQYRINLSILSIILLLLALALILVNMRKNRLKEERSRIQDVCSILEKEVVEQETRTEHLQQQLMHFREVARQERVRRFRQAGRLQSSIWRLDHLGVPAWFMKDPSLSAIKEELSYVYDIDDSGEKLLKRLDRELDGAIVPLMEKLNMQDKSQDQLFLCCCLLDLPSDVVGAKLGITPNNVRVKRHRLRDQIAKLNNADYNALFDIHK